MSNDHSLAGVAALIGDPSRANMLAALLDGRALTAHELAGIAGVSPATASGHLAKLVDGGLLARAVQGRHRYFRLASADVARMLEAILQVAGAPEDGCRATPRIAPELREIRTCYDHLAGRFAVELADALVAHGALLLDGESGTITESGIALFERAGVALGRATGSRRPFCRPCLDWSERRPHIGGVLGAALLDRALAQDWVRRAKVGRAVSITPRGKLGFAEAFGLPL